MRRSLATLTAAVLVSSCAADLIAPPDGAHLAELAVANNTDAIATTMTWSGPTTVQAGSQPVYHVRGTVTATGQPIEHLLVSCYGTGINGDIFGTTIRTDANGEADCAPPLMDTPTGVYETVICASIAPYIGCAPMFDVTVVPSTTSIAWAGPLTFQAEGDSMNLAARLTWSAGAAVDAWVRLFIMADDGYPLFACDAKTDWNGIARCATNVWLSAGPVTLKAEFNGDMLRVPAAVTVVGTAVAPPPPPPPAMPTTREQCFNGGWQQFAGFKNQGACVSWVATNGRSRG